MSGTAAPMPASSPQQSAAVDGLIAPHGGALRDLIVDGEAAAELTRQSRDFLSWDLLPPQLSDLELLLNGGFSPLAGFMTRADCDSVRSSMRLPNGTLWPVPVVLHVSESFAAKLHPAVRIALRDSEGVMLAVLDVEDVWRSDRADRALDAHPFCVGGRVTGLEPPIHYDFRTWRISPAAMRDRFRRMGWHRIIAVHARKTLHRAEQEQTLRAARDMRANLLLHSVVGNPMTDESAFTQVRCHEALLRTYPAGMAQMAVLPLADREAGPQAALWRAIVSRNFGCDLLMISGCEETGTTESPDAASDEALDLVRRHEQELGVQLIPLRSTARTLGGAELRAHLAVGIDIPEWFTFPEIAEELRRQFPARAHQGCTIFFTGLSGSGKSTIANVLRMKLLESGSRRPVTVLDGDLVRKHLSSELGFSKEHRDINIRRIGYVASEITKHGGFAICAPIAPYDGVRNDVRRMISSLGGFVLVHVATPLEVCERRDRKGLYAKARAGIVKEFTGISDPYEPPRDAEVVIDTTVMSPDAAAQQILAHLAREGYLT